MGYKTMADSACGMAYCSSCDITLSQAFPRNWKDILLSIKAKDLSRRCETEISSVRGVVM